MDEANLYDEVDVALELMADSINSFSKINNFGVSMGLTVVAITIFIFSLYRWVLPNHIKNVMFALPISEKTR
jgi:hypothetical protein